MVVHTCNLSYIGATGRRIMVQGGMMQKSQDPIGGGGGTNTKKELGAWLKG
jgi:hypothetical protein